VTNCHVIPGAGKVVVMEGAVGTDWSALPLSSSATARSRQRGPVLSTEEHL